MTLQNLKRVRSLLLLVGSQWSRLGSIKAESYDELEFLGFDLYFPVRIQQTPFSDGFSNFVQFRMQNKG